MRSLQSLSYRDLQTKCCFAVLVAKEGCLLLYDERSMTNDQGNDEFFGEDHELEVDVDVPKELVARIDAAILAHTKPAFQKVARIVSLAMKSISDAPENVTHIFYAQRIMHLVETGEMESEGDLRRMRFSEVRLPSPPLSAAELEDLIAQGDYWTLGCLYSEGQGVTRDYVTALRWYRIAAERGAVGRNSTSDVFI